MPLSYKNYATNLILNDLRNIRFANNEMLFDKNNTIDFNVKLQLDVEHISNQADVFAREIKTNRGKIDLKRFLGQYQRDWLRMLHEAYVYDRIRAIYYGLYSNRMNGFPDDVYSFPGNILLMNLINKQNFNFGTNDSQPYNLYLNLTYESDVTKIFKEIFETYPRLKEGMSDIKGVYSYVNSDNETILKGLYYASQYNKSRGNDKNNTKTFYEMAKLNDENIEMFTLGDSNPITNSFLSLDFKKFFFIFPDNQSGPLSMRNNESLFISRALGFSREQLTIDDNDFFKVAKRDISSDSFCRDEVYSVTGLSTNIVPYSEEQIKEYLSIDSWSNGGSDPDNGDKP